MSPAEDKPPQHTRMKVAGVPVKPDRKGSEGQIGLSTSALTDGRKLISRKVC